MEKVRIFLEHAPGIRIRHGVAHILDTGAGFDCDHTMSLETMQTAVERCQRALARYANGERDIYEGD
jgi:hypothetical protein